MFPCLSNISHQGCIGNHQNILLEEPPYLEFQNVLSSIPLPRVSNVRCQTVAPPSGNNTQNLTENKQSPQMMFKSCPDQRGQVVQSYAQPIQTQEYYNRNYQTSECHRQLQGPRLAISQLNYQRGVYHHPFGQTQPAISTTNVINGTSNNENRCGKNEIPYRYFSQTVPSQYRLEYPAGKKRTVKKNSTCGNNEEVENVTDEKPEVKSEVHCNFEYTIELEELVKSLCGDRGRDTTCPKMNNVYMRSLTCLSPSTSNGSSFLQQKQFEDIEFTKFLTQACLHGEAIATRNQNRPCFKNIKHICTRTRADIMKPTNTVANIHSQGIPWATKDFIFAFTRLINCWHILRGYLENNEGRLGKIDAVITPEIREKYSLWLNESKDLLRLLNSLFLKLDQGVTLENAEIFSKFNNLTNTSSPYVAAALRDDANSNTLLFKSPAREVPPDPTDYSKNNSPPNLTDKITEETIKNDSFTNGDTLAPPNIPGVLGVKETLNDSKETNKSHADKGYIKSVSYEISNLPDQSDLVPDSWETLASSPSTSKTELEVMHNVSKSHISPDKIWENAIKTSGSFIKRMMTNETEATQTMEETNETIKVKPITNTEDIKVCITEQCPVNNNVKENAEELPDNKKTILKCSNRKNMNPTRIFYKKIDERDVNHNKGRRYKNGNKSQTKYLSKKHEKVNITESSICEMPKRTVGLTPTSIDKFQTITNELWLLPFSRYITFEVYADYIPDYYKYINKPVFLSNIMTDLKLKKYKHVNEVVHDLRAIVWNSKHYVKNRPDQWFEKCLDEFSSELELLLSSKFANFNFRSVTGDPEQIPTCD
ncbi:mitoshell [Carabus blaptoides fortunei]